MIPEISVLVPVYNVEQYIKKCAESLFNNTIATSCEFIFTNDGSTDKSIEFLKETVEKFPILKEQIKIINHDKNYGIGKTRNTCLNNSKGKYIIFVDSDDWVDLNYLEELLFHAKKNSSDITGCDIYFEFPDNTKIISYPLQDNPRELLFNIYDRKVAAYLFIKLIKRDFIINNNISFSDDILCLEDLLFITQILLKNPRISYLSKPLYHYFIRQGSILHSLYDIKKADNIFLAVKYINDYLTKYNDKDLNNKFIERTYLFKYEVIQKGKINTQKKYLNMYPELNNYINSNNTKKIYNIFKC